MNKNDFYKELMTQYALDPEKIRMNALRQAKKPAWQRIAGDYWKPAIGAAAAVAVSFAAVSYANRSSAPDIVLDPGEALSASQRLMEAEMNYYNTQRSEDFSDIYVTFMEPLSYNEILMTLSTVADFGEFELCTIYLENDILTGWEIEDYSAAYSDDKTAVAVKVALPASYYRDIQDLSVVYLAELGSAEINDETFTPMVVEDDDPLHGDYLSITGDVTEAPVVTTTPFSFSTVTEPEEEKPVIGESSNGETVTTLPPESDDETEEEAPVDVEETEEGDYDETPETESTTPPVTTVPDTTTTTTNTTYYGGEVGLLTQIYELNVANALEAHTAGNNVIVLAKNEAYLYTLSGFTASQNGTVIAINSPRVAYKGEDCMILTGCRSDGTRGMISVINLETDRVHTYDAGANIGGCEISGICYSKEDGKYFMKAVTAESTLIYELSVNGDIQFRPLVEIEAPVALAGYNSNTLYFSFLENGSITRLYSFSCIDGSMNEIIAFNGKVKIKRGEDFRSFAVLSLEDGAGYVYDVNTQSLVPALFDETVKLVTKGNTTYFNSNGNNFRIDPYGTTAEAIFEYVSYETIVEEIFVINEITPEKVVVIFKDESAW